MGKHSKVFPSTKWKFGENVVLQLMECLAQSVSCEIFMGKYFTSFRLLTHLELTTFMQHVCSTKIYKVTQMHHHSGQTAAKKKNVPTLNSAHQAEK